MHYISMEVSGGSSDQQRRGGVKVPGSGTLKEKRARFYIIRRCVCMLVCWRKKDAD